MSDTDVEVDEDGNWQTDFYDAEHRQRLRKLLDEKDPQRRKRIFDAIEWDAVCEDLMVVIDDLSAPIPMRLPCPECRALHVDEGEFATKPHHTHACQECGQVWRPAVEATVGVRFLPGFKNDESTGAGLTNIEGSPSGLQIGTVKEALKGWSDWLGDLEPVLADEPWLDDPIARGFCPRCGTPTDIHGDECPDWAGQGRSSEGGE